MCVSDGSFWPLKNWLLTCFLCDNLFLNLNFSDFLFRSCSSNADLVSNVLILVFPDFFLSWWSMVFWCFANFPLFSKVIMTWTWAISVLSLSILLSRLTIHFGFSCFQFLFSFLNVVIWSIISLQEKIVQLISWREILSIDCKWANCGWFHLQF